MSSQLHTYTLCPEDWIVLTISFALLALPSELTCSVAFYSAMKLISQFVMI